MVKNLFAKDITYTLRGLCMLMIIICHTVVHHKEVTPPTFLNYLFVQRWGMWASALFLFLSGFGMFFSIKNAGEISLSYIMRKMRKLLQPFLFVWCVYLLLFLFFDRHKFSWSLVTDFFTLAVPYAETWFYREIVALYLFSFLIFYFLKNNLLRVVSVVLVCIVFYLICAHFTSLGRWWYNATLCFPIGLFFAWRWETIKTLPSYLVLLLTIALFILCNLFYPYDVLYGILFSVMMPYLFSIFNISIRALKFIGVYSLCYYLLESPIKGYFVAYFHHENFYLYIFLCVIGITLATLFYKQIERFVEQHIF